MRAIGSSKVDPYSAMAGAAAALYGPLHGGANEAVLRMLGQIGRVENVPEFVARVKSGDAEWLELSGEYRGRTLLVEWGKARVAVYRRTGLAPWARWLSPCATGSGIRVV